MDFPYDEPETNALVKAHPMKKPAAKGSTEPKWHNEFEKLRASLGKVAGLINWWLFVMVLFGTSSMVCKLGSQIVPAVSIEAAVDKILDFLKTKLVLQDREMCTLATAIVEIQKN